MLFLLLIFITAACAECTGNSDGLLAKLRSNPSFSTYAKFFDGGAAGQRLQLGQNYTIFATPDSGFVNSNVGINQFLGTDLFKIMTYTVIPGNIEVELEPQNLTTVQGDRFYITQPGNNKLPQVNMNANLVSLSVALEACNGRVYSVDRVIVPPCFVRNDGFQAIIDFATQDPAFKGLAEAVVASNTLNLLANTQYPTQLTVLAPSNQAWKNANLPTAMTPAQVAMILEYHLIRGKILASDLAPVNNVTTLNGQSLVIKNPGGGEGVNVAGYASVIEANLQVCNGVFHEIDHVLIPPCGANSPISSILTHAAATPELSTLTGLIRDNLPILEALSGAGPFTVFAPTNEAFVNANLPGNADVANILKGHVIPGRVLSSDLKDQQSVVSLNGDSVLIEFDGKNVIINGYAMVVTANVVSCNGVVHIIDHVIIPKCGAQSFGTIASRLAFTAGTTTFTKLLVQTGELQYLEQPGPLTVFAPSDQAFLNFNASATSCTVPQILLHHMYSGARLLASDFPDSEILKMEDQTNIVVFNDNGAVTIDPDVHVVTANQQACNGVFHLVDKVIIPSQCSNQIQEQTPAVLRKLHTMRKK